MSCSVSRVNGLFSRRSGVYLLHGTSQQKSFKPSDMQGFVVFLPGTIRSVFGLKLRFESRFKF